MKSLILSTFDQIGGAARSAYRLHQGLRAIGVDSMMLVQSKTGDDHSVEGPTGKIAKGIGLARPSVEAVLTRLVAGKTNADFSTSVLPFSGIRSKALAAVPDVVNLHWVCGGMLRVEDVPKLATPVVWTLHDMWAFTGGCHYSGPCSRYAIGCGECPQITRRSSSDISTRVIQRKLRRWNDMQIAVVSPSRWLASRASSSAVFRETEIDVIPYGLNLSVYKPSEKLLARRAWNLPENSPIILFGAVLATSDPRKGFDLLYQALHCLREKGLEDALLVVFGASAPSNPPDLPFPAVYAGKVHDDVSLSLLYAAADVTVIPSREDNLPNVAIESMACGTPVVAFDVGGLPEIVDHGINGYIAGAENSPELAEGIYRILTENTGGTDFRYQARASAELKYDLHASARAYALLFDRILEKKHQGG